MRSRNTLVGVAVVFTAATAVAAVAGLMHCRRWEGSSAMRRRVRMRLIVSFVIGDSDDGRS